MTQNHEIPSELLHKVTGGQNEYNNELGEIAPQVTCTVCGEIFDAAQVERKEVELEKTELSCTVQILFKCPKCRDFTPVRMFR